MRNFIIIAFPFFLYNGCCSNPDKKFNNDKTFPAVVKLQEFKRTVFIPTLETNLNLKNNSIYAATLLMAWDEVKREISEPIKSIESHELNQINLSDSYQNVLSENEYMTNVEIQDNRILAKAYFKKSLPYETPLFLDNYPLIFKNDTVKSFGFNGYHQTAKIAYYHNNNDFAILLIPSDTEHEIILIKTNFSTNICFKNVMNAYLQNQLDFQNNRNEKNQWRYSFNEEDKVRIPIIEFNIETNFPSIEGTFMYTDTRKILIEELIQRTGFVLNEKGAEVESYSEVSALEENEEELPEPKKMIFDSPFVIILKKKLSKYPYFAMIVSNSELMIKK